jgi:hypothetical protein
VDALRRRRPRPPGGGSAPDPVCVALARERHEAVRRALLALPEDL